MIELISIVISFASLAVTCVALKFVIEIHSSLNREIERCQQPIAESKKKPPQMVEVYF